MTFLPAFTQRLAEGRITSVRLLSSSAGLEQTSPACKRGVTGLHSDLPLRHPVVARQAGLDFQVLGVLEGRVSDLEEIERLVETGQSWLFLCMYVRLHKTFTIILRPSKRLESHKKRTQRPGHGISRRQGGFDLNLPRTLKNIGRHEISLGSYHHSTNMALVSTRTSKLLFRGSRRNCAKDPLVNNPDGPREHAGKDGCRSSSIVHPETVAYAKPFVHCQRSHRRERISLML